MLPATINIFEKAARKAGRILVRDFGEIENLQIQLATTILKQKELCF